MTVYKCELTLDEVEAICKAIAPPPLQTNIPNLNRYNKWKQRFPNIYKMHENIREIRYLNELSKVDINKN